MATAPILALRASADRSVQRASGARRPALAGVLARAAQTRSPARAAAVAVLRQGAGNRAVARVLARVKKYAGLYENPNYASTVFPYREGLLKRFVSIYRFMELKEGSEEQTKAAWEAARKALQAEVDRIAALPTPTKADTAKKKEIEGILKQTKLSMDQMASMTGEWEARLLSGASVATEVQRHLGAGRVPAWLKPMIEQYSGMRYQSAHGDYHSPRRLLYVLAYGEAEAAAKTAKTKTWKVDPAVVAELKGLSDETVLQRLRDLRSNGRIPDAAWQSIVRVTELKLDAEGPATLTGDEKAKLEGQWKTIVTRWKDGSFSDPLTGEAGSRAWLTELKRSGAQTMMGVVCNQLAEAAARQRGIKLTSGISQNEGDFYAASQNAAGKAPEVKDAQQAVASYFKHPDSDEDFRPAANLFFIDRDWADADPGSHAIVRYRPGFDYPVAPAPEYVKAWKQWKAGDDAYTSAKRTWDDRMKKAKTDAAKKEAGPAPAEPTAKEPEFKGVTSLPANGETIEDWTYHVATGEAITRTHVDGRKQWMKWSHQATVVRRLGNRVFTFETVKSGVWGDGAGMGERTTAELKNNLKVFIGWMPGDDPQYEVPSTPPATTPATPPSSPPASVPPASAMTPAPASGPTCALPEPDEETAAEREARQCIPAP
jgi:hypothetical protein